ncbi:MAG: UPF0149 family protein [Xanthomonadales bacterium]|jgi:hypothetical protein|nr:UPF0149 family protein [Xanthomonadales bacterium]
MPVQSFELLELLSAHELGLSTAQAHGVLCGLVAALGVAAPIEWLDLALGEPGFCAELPERDQALLARLRSEVQAAYTAEEFVLAPMLPDEDGALAPRVEALSEWCRGFLAGLGQAGLPRGWPESDEVREALRDLDRIAATEVELSGDDEEDERDLAELIEFARFAALMVAEDLGAEHAPTRH